MINEHTLLVHKGSRSPINREQNDLFFHSSEVQERAEEHQNELPLDLCDPCDIGNGE